MKIYFISKQLNDAEVVVPENEFDLIPQIDDYVDVKSYLSTDDYEKFTNHLKNLQKIELGRVIARNWSKKEGENIIYIGLEFEDYKDQE